MLRSVLIILSGNLAGAVLQLARSLILARLIPVADFGVAATFALVMSVIDMITAFGLQTQIVQAKDGDDPRLQAALQGFQLVRGAVSSALLLVLAHPIAIFMNLEEVAWAYQLMALIPLISAFAHFDNARMTRRMHYLPSILTNTVPPLVGVLAVWPLAWWLGDWRVLLVLNMLQVSLGVLISHLLAERSYSVVFDRTIALRGLRFGWPIMLNNVLLFGVFNGDRAIIGRELGMEALAFFAMGMTLTLSPTIVLAKSLQSFFLPQLAPAWAAADASGLRGRDPRFARLGVATIQATVLVGLLFLAATVLVGGPVVHLLVGDKYLALLPVLIWFAAMQVARVLKAGPAIVALSAGETRNAMVANLVRVMTLPFTFWVAVTTGDFVTILWIVTAGEVAGQATALAMLRRTVRLDLAPLWPSHLLAGLVLVISCAQALSLTASDPAQAIRPAPWPVALGMLTLLAFSVGTMPELRRAAARHWRRSR